MVLSALRLKTAALALVCALVPVGGVSETPIGVHITNPGETAYTQQVTLALDKSTIIDLDIPAGDIVITNPTIADAAVQTAQRMIFRGISVGQTNAFVFDRQGNQILNLEIVVVPDMAALNQLIKRHVPNARVQAEAVGTSIILTGFADSLADADRALQLAEAFSPSDEEGGVVSLIGVDATEQVLLQVRVVEMQRSAAKQLGVDLAGSAQLNENVAIALATNNAFGALDALGTSSAAGALDDGTSVANATISALESVGILRTLAEPNMTAISGETANFLAGGEFPVPTGEGEDGAITIEFQPFGVGLAFTPVVLNEGRISLKISTEVSELTTEGSLQAATTVIPALAVRRAETTVELPSGQSMMIAGLIQSSTRQDLAALPGVRNLPILGSLFQGRDFVNEETELVVIVTPYLVDPANPNELATPADGFISAKDTRTALFSKLNRVYGRDREAAASGEYRAPIGFIEE